MQLHCHVNRFSVREASIGAGNSSMDSNLSPQATMCLSQSVFSLIVCTILTIGMLPLLTAQVSATFNILNRSIKENRSIGVLPLSVDWDY
jgi:hypothetical protein